MASWATAPVGLQVKAHFLPVFLSDLYGSNSPLKGLGVIFKCWNSSTYMKSAAKATTEIFGTALNVRWNDWRSVRIGAHFCNFVCGTMLHASSNLSIVTLNHMLHKCDDRCACLLGRSGMTMRVVPLGEKPPVILNSWQRKTVSAQPSRLNCACFDSYRKNRRRTQTIVFFFCYPTTLWRCL